VKKKEGWRLWQSRGRGTDASFEEKENKKPMVDVVAW
jgi:hypothetical protein